MLLSTSLATDHHTRLIPPTSLIHYPHTINTRPTLSIVWSHTMPRNRGPMKHFPAPNQFFLAHTISTPSSHNPSTRSFLMPHSPSGTAQSQLLIGFSRLGNNPVAAVSFQQHMLQSPHPLGWIFHIVLPSRIAEPPGPSSLILPRILLPMLALAALSTQMDHSTEPLVKFALLPVAKLRVKSTSENSVSTSDILDLSRWEPLWPQPPGP